MSVDARRISCAPPPAKTTLGPATMSLSPAFWSDLHSPTSPDTCSASLLTMNTPTEARIEFLSPLGTTPSSPSLPPHSTRSVVGGRRPDNATLDVHVGGATGRAARCVSNSGESEAWSSAGCIALLYENTTTTLCRCTMRPVPGVALTLSLGASGAASLVANELPFRGPTPSHGGKVAQFIKPTLAGPWIVTVAALLIAATTLALYLWATSLNLRAPFSAVRPPRRQSFRTWFQWCWGWFHSVVPLFLKRRRSSFTLPERTLLLGTHLLFLLTASALLVGPFNVRSSLHVALFAATLGLLLRPLPLFFRHARRRDLVEPEGPQPASAFYKGVEREVVVEPGLTQLESTATACLSVLLVFVGAAAVVLAHIVARELPPNLIGVAITSWPLAVLIDLFLLQPLISLPFFFLVVTRTSSEPRHVPTFTPDALPPKTLDWTPKKPHSSGPPKKTPKQPPGSKTTSQLRSPDKDASAFSSVLATDPVSTCDDDLD